MPPRSRPPKTAPAWEVVEGGSVVRFAAIPMRMRTLVLGILGIVIVVGLGLAAALIIVDVALGFRSGSRVIVFAGLLIALPAAAVFLQVLRRRTTQCRVFFDSESLRADVGADSVTVAFRDLDRLVWRQDTDYARVVIRAGEQHISLMTGLAKAPATVLPQLPALTTTIVESLVAAGLTERPSGRAGWTEFRRPSSSENRNA